MSACLPRLNIPSFNSKLNNSTPQPPPPPFLWQEGNTVCNARPFPPSYAWSLAIGTRIPSSHSPHTHHRHPERTDITCECNDTSSTLSNRNNNNNNTSKRSKSISANNTPAQIHEKSIDKSFIPKPLQRIYQFQSICIRAAHGSRYWITLACFFHHPWKAPESPNLNSRLVLNRRSIGLLYRVSHHNRTLQNVQNQLRASRIDAISIDNNISRPRNRRNEVQVFKCIYCTVVVQGMDWFDDRGNLAYLTDANVMVCRGNSRRPEVAAIILLACVPVNVGHAFRILMHPLQWTRAHFSEFTKEFVDKDLFILNPENRRTSISLSKYRRISNWRKHEATRNTRVHFFAKFCCRIQLRILLSLLIHFRQVHCIF